MLTKMALLLLFLQQTPVTTGAHPSENLSAKLRTTVHDCHLLARNFVEALAHVAGEFQIPMGIEWVSQPSARARIDLSFKHTTVQQVLQAIVNAQPGTKMVTRRGIVHIFSPELIPDRENPLKLSINGFEVRNVRAELASRQLHETVKRTLYPTKPQQGLGRGGGVASSGASNVDDPTISLKLKNPTVEDVLDAIASASARKIWIVTFSDTRTLTAAGYRRTLGLWASSPVPDEDQPVWDMVHWEDALPSVSSRSIEGGRGDPQPLDPR